MEWMILDLSTGAAVGPLAGPRARPRNGRFAGCGGVARDGDYVGVGYTGAAGFDLQCIALADAYGVRTDGKRGWAQHIGHHDVGMVLGPVVLLHDNGVLGVRDHARHDAPPYEDLQAWHGYRGKYGDERHYYQYLDQGKPVSPLPVYTLPKHRFFPERP